MPMNPLALMMSRGMQPVPPDYAMPGPAPDMETAYAKMEAAQAGQGTGTTDDEIVDFIRSVKPYVMQMPPKLQLKFSKLWQMVESQARENYPEYADSQTTDMAAHYGPSAAPLQEFLDRSTSDGREAAAEEIDTRTWGDAEWEKWEEQQDAMTEQYLQDLLRGYGKGR